MLILSRKQGQSIIINKTIKVRVLRWDRNSVKLGIDAPLDIEVNREEVEKRKNSHKEVSLLNK